MKSNKILITGAAGNLGGILANYLIDRNLNYGDTTRMHNELLPKLKYKTYKEGLEIF
ncbi:MAG: hypothetical protein LBR81_06285 [Prevotellaceae bacterium]|jgi:nucleoside-diphosphate-sugar epimerase|nr:hypothetical protein [Prevotellaceae bacterium]